MPPISRRSLLTVLGLGAGTTLVGCSEPEREVILPPSTSSAAGGPPKTSSTSSTSSTSTGPATSEKVDLPAPDELRDPWAAWTATWATIQDPGSGGPRVDRGDWYFENFEGQWAYLLRYRSGKAVLVGSSDLNIVREDGPEKEQRERLLAAGEKWWGDAFGDLPANGHLGFVCAWDGKEWRRTAGVEGRGGLGSLDFFITSRTETAKVIAQLTDIGEGEYRGKAKIVADAIVKAGPAVTEAQLEGLGSMVRSARDGVAAAKAFTDKPRR